MKKKALITTLIFIIFLVFVFLLTKNISAETQSSTQTKKKSQAYDASLYRDKTFYRTYNSWLKDGLEVVELDNPLSFNYEENTLEKKVFDSIEYSKGLIGDSITYKVNAPSEGLYEIGLRYYMEEEFYTNPTIDILVNDAYQFNEAMSLPLEVSWFVKEREENDRYNRYGNELLPLSSSSLSSYLYYLEDNNEMYSYNYKFHLNEGINTIVIKPVNMDLYLSNIYLNNEKALIKYSDYDLTKDSDTKGYLKTIEGESFYLKNDLSIKQTYYKDKKVTPYSYKTTVLNTLDGGSMAQGGSYIEYKFNVDKTGYYNIALKYLHDSNLGVVASKNIYIDGEILYEELSGYNFETARNWTNIYLKDDNGDNLMVYLENGVEHTLRIESSTAYAAGIIDELHGIMDWINSTGLNVKVITGGETSKIITQYITKYLPTLESDLISYANRIKAIYDELLSIDTGVKNSAPEVSSLEVAYKQLLKIAKKPNKINSNLNLFSDGSGSAYQLIGEAVTSLSDASMDIDKIYLVGVGEKIKLPKAKSNIFEKIAVGLQSFFYSFFDKRYKLNRVKDDNTLEVWVQQSSIYVDIMQTMVDEAGFDFDVQLSVLPSSSKIVLSSSTGDNPDVILSIDTWEPYSYALRGILENLRGYPGFYDLTENVADGNFTPLIFEDGVYGIPETTSVYLLYYRKDILESLNIPIPNTWSETLEMLYTLQSYSMNFYHPMSGDSSYKSFGLVSPFIFQFNGEIFSYDGLTSTLEDENTIDAIDFLTGLYTVYNLPQQVSSFFEHFRTGTMPIGVSTVDLYLQMQYAAPEIAGQWGVTVIPGIYDESTNDVERWSATYGKCSVLFSNSDMKDEGWELIKWWNSAETQMNYVKNIKMSLGERYMVIPANKIALRQSVWDDEIKDVILEMEKYSMTPAVTPGSYIVERELSQIWNKIVIDKMPVRQAISESIPRINRELKRKLNEFGYINPDGTSSYRVPISSNLGGWLHEQ